MEGNNTLTQYNTQNKVLMDYNLLEKQVIQMALEEPEDPPETLHTPWGIWLHHWDALHTIDQKYDTEHVIRTTKVAEDILFYYHYPAIEQEHIASAYGINSEYDYFEESIYNPEGGGKQDPEDFEAGEVETEQPLETEDDYKFFEEREDMEDSNIYEKPDEPNNEKPKICFNLSREIQLVKIFERFFMRIS